MDEITTEENDLLPKLKPYEIYLFNLWLFFALLIFICLFVVIMPEDFISDYFGIIFPAKYWFIAVPTHILTTLLGLTICIKGFELIYTTIHAYNGEDSKYPLDPREEENIKQNFDGVFNTLENKL